MSTSLYSRRRYDRWVSSTALLFTIFVSSFAMFLFYYLLSPFSLSLSPFRQIETKLQIKRTPSFFCSRGLDIPFETEAELRVRGTARTPDVLLSIPLGIRVRRRIRDDSSRRNLFCTTHAEGGGAPDDKMALPQRLLFGEKDVKISPALNRLGTIDDYLKDDDDYEWKSICES